MTRKRASNIEVKKINRNRVFRFVNNREHASKPEIAAALGLSTPTVLQIINEFIDEGIVVEVGEYASTGGRKAAAIASIKDKYCALGVDITQNHIGFALTDLSGDVLKHKRIHFPYRNDEDYYQEFAKKVNSFMEENAIDGSEFLGFGISLPGIIDSNRKMLIYSHTLNVRNLSLSRFSDVLQGESKFINDANAAAVAELYHLTDRKDTVYLSLSNSVGGAIIKTNHDDFGSAGIKDLLDMGTNGRAGEFGHMTLVPDGDECYCGKKGCMDAYCNAKILAALTDNKLETFFEKLALDGDEFKKQWDSYLDYLAISVNNLRMAFDCRIIIGGYVGSHIEPYIDSLRERAEKRNTFEADASYIDACVYKVESSALGAALTQIDAFISNI